MPFGFCLSAFFILWTGNDLFNEMARFQAEGLGMAGIAKYYFLKSPEFMATVVPVALLFGMLFALSRHARYNEIIAARAAGISIWRLAFPYYVVGILSGVIIFLANNVWLADGAQRASELIGGKHIPEAQKVINQWVFVNDTDQRNWEAKSYNRETGHLLIGGFDWKKDDRWHQVKAEEAFYTNGVWRFERVLYREFDVGEEPPGAVPKEFMEFTDFSENPERIESEIRVKTMDLKRASKKVRFTMAEIREYLDQHPNLRGREYYMMHTQKHALLSMPWTSLVVVIIAIPFGTLNARKNLFAGFAGTVAICFTYFILNRLGLVLGTSGQVAPWMGAWLANIVFIVGGMFVTWKLR